MPLPSMYNQSGFGQPQVNQQQVQGMSLNMPLNFVQPQQPQPQVSSAMIGLHGLDSAKQFPVKPNMTVPTFDLDSDHGFILNADTNGVVNVTIFKYEIVTEDEYRKSVEKDTPIQIPRSEYEALKDRLNKLEEEVKNGKQLVRKRTASNTNSTGKSYSAAKSTDESANSIDDSDV